MESRGRIGHATTHEAAGTPGSGGSSFLLGLDGLAMADGARRSKDRRGGSRRLEREVFPLSECSEVV